MVGHILDTERIYVANAAFGRYPLQEWLDEFSLVRRSNATLVRHLPEDAWRRIGHERHHLRIIQDKYLAA